MVCPLPAAMCSHAMPVHRDLLYTERPLPPGAIASLGMQTARPAHAAELQTSSSGLKYEDTKVGTGKEASKGTMIRQGFSVCTLLQPGMQRIMQHAQVARSLNGMPVAGVTTQAG